MTLVPRIAFLASLVVTTTACPTDPGDVGSESATLSDSAADDEAGSAESESSGSASADDGGSSGTESDSASNSATQTASDDGDPTDGGSSGATVTDDGGPGSSDDGASSSAGDSADGGTMVADCSECGPAEGCVAEVAFATEYFCVPIPEGCPGIEFDCDCASEYCVDPFTVCQDFPDPPQRAIACECPNC